MLWPDDAPDFAEQVWCVEVELTAKTAQGTAPIVSELSDARATTEAAPQPAWRWSVGDVQY